MRVISQKALTALRERFPAGTRVELVRMDDVQAPPPGTQGSVIAVDDLGTVHVNWDNGSSLGVAYGEDQCRKIKSSGS